MSPISVILIALSVIIGLPLAYTFIIHIPAKVWYNAKYQSMKEFLLWKKKSGLSKEE